MNAREAAQLRDEVFDLAKCGNESALERARAISLPWYRAQALAAVAYHEVGSPLAYAREARQAAIAGKDAYQQSAVRTWEIAALAERGYCGEAREALREALALSRTVTPPGSRAEALVLLLQAAFAIGQEEALAIQAEINAAFEGASYWRCRRAVRNAAAMLRGEYKVRKFF